jgi:alkaline phosphatase D
MPIRRPQVSAPQIYRSLDWGDFARILLLDTRYIGRDRQLDYRRELLPALAGGGDAAQTVAAFRRERLDIEQRTLLGAAQEAWFARTLAESKTRGQAWQVIAQQVVMGEQIAAPGLTRLLPPDLSAGSRQWFAAGEQVSALGLPWNVDSWSGYPAARRRFLEACAADSANALVLAGDSHNCWINNLQAPAGRRLAAIEFAGGSVTSPGFERSLSNAQPGERETMMRGANANLAWCDLTNRGYGAFKLTRASCEAEWIAFPSTRERERPTPTITKLVSQASTASGPGAWAAA